jgi:hypothetical protein
MVRKNEDAGGMSAPFLGGSSTAQREKHHFLDRALQGQWLPLFTDKVRNNVKSRVVLTLAYANAAALVLVIIMVSLSIPQPGPRSLRWSVPPPSQGSLGTALAPFSVQFLDGYSNPVAKELVLATVIPITEIPLATSLPEGDVLWRTIKCVDSTVIPFNKYTYFDLPLCLPHNGNLVLNFTTVTDNNGVARFSKFTVLHGAPTDYILVVVAAENTANPLLLHSFLSLSAAPYKMTFTRAVLSQSVATPLREPVTYVVTARVLSVNQPQLAAGAFVAVDIDSPFSQNPRSAPLGNTGVREKAIIISDNPFFIFSNWTSLDGVVTPSANDTSTSSTNVATRWEASVVINATVAGSNGAGVYLAAFFWGKLVPLEQFNVKGQVPQRLFLPQFYVPKVSALAMIDAGISPSPPTLQSTYQLEVNAEEGPILQVVEGSSLPIYVTVAPETPYVPVYLELLPFASDSTMGYSYSTHPGVNSKTLLGGYSITNGSGVALFPESTKVSVAGAIGLYELLCIVDGVNAQWEWHSPSFNFSAGSNSTSVARRKRIQTRLLLNITSSVHFPSIVFRAGDANVNISHVIETVGEPWNQVPSILVKDGSGNVIAGKEFILRPEDPFSVGLTFQTVSNAESGWTTASFVAASFAKCRGANQAGSTGSSSSGFPSYVPTEFAFLIEVDHRIVARFRRWVQQPESALSSSSGSSSDGNGLGSCAAIIFLSVPPRVWVGKPAPLVALVVDRQGNPVPNADIFEILQPQLGDVSRRANYTANASGIGSWIEMVYGVRAEYTATVLLKCLHDEDNSLIFGTSLAAVPLLPRFQFVESSDQDFSAHPNYVELGLAADWSMVNAQYPLYIRAQNMFTPEYAINFDETPQFSYALAASPGPVFLPLFNGPPNGSPGLYIFTLMVDEVAAIDAVFLFIPPRAVGISLVRSALADPNALPSSESHVFPVQPILRLFGSSPGSNLSGIQVFAQLGVVEDADNDPAAQTPPTNVRWLVPGTTPADLQLGALYTQSAGFRPRSNAAQDDGQVAFTGLGIAGLSPEARFTIRYCYYCRALDPTVAFLPDVCVTEATTFTRALFDLSSFELAIVPNTVLVAPGGYLPAFTVSLTIGGVPADSVIAVDPDLTLQQKAAGVSFFVPLLLRPSQNGFHRFNSTADGLRIGYSTPGGVYKLAIIVPGAVQYLFVTVQNTVASIHRYGPLTERLTQYQLGSTVPVSVIARSQSRAPVSGAVVEMTLTLLADGNATARARPGATLCVRSGCGIFDSTATVLAETDRRGIADFSFAVQSAQNGSFQVQFALASRLSPIALGQGVASSFDGAALLYGVTSNRAVEVLSIESPSLTSYYGFLSMVASEAESQRQSSSISASDLTVTQRLGQATDKLKDKLQRWLNGDLDDLISSLQVRSTQLRTALHIPITINNPVADIQCCGSGGTSSWSQQRFVLTGQLLPGGAASVDSFRLGAGAPTLRPVDATGSPLWATGLPGQQQRNTANFTLQFTVLPTSSSAQLTLPGPISQYINPSTGILSLTGAVLAVSQPGEYDLYITANGGGNVILSKVFVVTTQETLSLGDLMKYVAAALVICYSPILVSSVPYSRTPWTVMAVLCSFAFFLGTSIYLYTSISSIAKNDLAVIWFFFVGALAALLFVSVTILSVLYQFGSQSWKNRAADSTKAVEVLLYTQWITNVRIDKQDEELVQRETAPPKLIQWFADKHDRATRSLHRKFNRHVVRRLKGGQTFQDLVGGVVGNPSDSRQRVSDERPPLHRPSCIPTAIYTPMNFWIVNGLTFVITFVEILLMLFVLSLLRQLIAKLLITLPDPTSADDAQRVQSTTDTFAAAIQLLTQVIPETSFLSPLVDLIQGFDILNWLAKFRSFLAIFSQRLVLAFGVGLPIATFSIVLACLWHFKAIPRIISNARRGVVEVEGDLKSGESYIGLHCFHFAMTFQLVFWPVIAAVLGLSVSEFRDYLWSQVGVILEATIIAKITTVLLESIFVGTFLTNGYFALRPEMYAGWHFAALILGVFSGLFDSIWRWIMGLVYFSVLFPRLDVSIYPSSMTGNDGSYAGFHAVLIAESKNGNPIFLMFSSLIWTNWQLKKCTEAGVNAVIPETFGESEKQYISSVILSLSRMWLRRVGKKQLPPATAAGTYQQLLLEGVIGQSSESMNFVFPHLLCHANGEGNRNGFRFDKVQQRWWLLMMLHFNPSLRKLRKHAMYVTSDGAIGKADSDFQGDTPLTTMEDRQVKYSNATQSHSGDSEAAVNGHHAEGVHIQMSSASSAEHSSYSFLETKYH